MIQKSGAGVVIPPEQPENLAETVIRLFENRDELARASLAVALGHSRERQARSMLEMLEEVASG